MSDSLPSTLEALGYRVRRRADSFDVLLPFWCRVRVTETTERLKLEPRFELSSRTTATWIWIILFWVLLLSMVFVIPRPDPLALGTVFFIVVVGVMDVYRYILTEHAMQIVRHVYLDRLPRA